MTSAFVKEALDKGATCSGGSERRRAWRQAAAASKVRGIGVAVSPYRGGSIGFDGLFVIKPDGRLSSSSRASATSAPSR